MSLKWPLSYRWARANGVRKLVPWHFMDGDEGLPADNQFKKERTDLRVVRTFARRQDCDDFAGFLVVDGQTTDRVVCFHPSFAGTPNEFMIDREFENFWAFVTEVVIPDTQDWSTEEDISGLA